MAALYIIYNVHKISLTTEGRQMDNPNRQFKFKRLHATRLQNNH